MLFRVGVSDWIVMRKAPDQIRKTDCDDRNSCQQQNQPAPAPDFRRLIWRLGHCRILAINQTTDTKAHNLTYKCIYDKLGHTCRNYDSRASDCASWFFTISYLSEHIVQLSQLHIQHFWNCNCHVFSFV